MNLISKILFIICIGTMTLFSQTDWEKWGKVDFSYKMHKDKTQRNYNISGDNAGQILLNSAAIGYWLFISDVDGDNCPFSPTCSSFFLQSVKETNIVQGTLMFADRFTRDMDIFGRTSHYPIAKNRHFYDPPALYTLDKSKIKYIPAGVTVNN
jgi:putative component of membrane protein insertase Oxa1/YidC/SpoIIIJ protein YidD